MEKTWTSTLRRVVVASVIAGLAIGSAHTVSAQERVTPQPEIATTSSGKCAVDSEGRIGARSASSGELVLQYRTAGVWSDLVRREVVSRETVLSPGPWTDFSRAGRGAFRASVLQQGRTASVIVSCEIVLGTATTPAVPASPNISKSSSNYCRAQGDNRVLARSSTPGVMYMQAKLDNRWAVVGVLEVAAEQVVAFPQQWRKYVQPAGQAELRVTLRVGEVTSAPDMCSISSD